MSTSENKKKLFTKLVVENHLSLQRFALSLCKNNFDADDLVSETILKAHDNFGGLKDQGKVRQWLFRIMNNQFISNYRKRKKMVEIGNEDRDENENNFSLFEALSKTDFVEEGNPEKKFISALTQKQFENAINELPEEFREAIVLCDMEDFSYEEISSILVIPIGTVRSRVSRARMILQKKLWLYAKELGIKTAKKPKEKSNYTCTCGKEENEIQLSSAKTFEK
ncbi:MAG: RNA polymerase sigma factor [Bacteroidetes bacterium]|nr:RNA polymerase sigma factor [Bacteroidota bacterium]